MSQPWKRSTINRRLLRTLGRQLLSRAEYDGCARWGMNCYHFHPRNGRCHSCEDYFDTTLRNELAAVGLKLTRVHAWQHGFAVSIGMYVPSPSDPHRAEYRLERFAADGPLRLIHQVVAGVCLWRLATELS